MIKNERNSQLTKRRIIEAATKEFKKFGFRGARLSSIIDEACVNIRMIYHYYGDKTGLFQAVIKEQLELIRLMNQDSNEGGPLDSINFCYKQNDSLYTLLKLCFIIEAEDIELKEDREKIFEELINFFERIQEKNHKSDNLDPKFFLMVIISIRTFPRLVPKLLRSINREEYETQYCVTNYSQVLKRILDLEEDL